MGVKEFTGKTVSDAITAASVELGVTSDNLNYEVVEKGNAGFLGLGSKDAVIRILDEEEVAKREAEKESAKSASSDSEVLASDNASSANDANTAFEASNDSSKSSEKKENKPSDPACVDVATEFLKDVFAAMKLDVEISCDLKAEENVLDIELVGPEMGVIIGKRGQTLDSLQYLVNLAVNRKVSTYTKVKIDTEDYRRRRKETLENLAKNCAYRAKRSRKPVSLEAMNPYERRIIHFALQDDNYVTTHSEGEEPYRHVVIVPKND